MKKAMLLAAFLGAVMMCDVASAGLFRHRGCYRSAVCRVVKVHRGCCVRVRIVHRGHCHSGHCHSGQCAR